MVLWKLGYGFLFAFHTNCGSIFSRFDTIHKRDRHPARHPATPLYTASLGCSHTGKIWGLCLCPSWDTELSLQQCVCEFQSKDRDIETTYLRSEIESLQTRLLTKLDELGETESSVLQLTGELTSTRADLSAALDTISKNDTTIVDLNDQISLLHHEVCCHLS